MISDGLLARRALTSPLALILFESDGRSQALAASGLDHITCSDRGF